MMLVIVAITAFLPVSAAGPGQSSDRFNMPGNLLIADQYNNRVIEVNPQTKHIVWSFGSGNGMMCNPGAGTVIGPNDAERLADGLTLISGSGIGSSIPGTTPCTDNRVIVVNQGGQIVWQYGQAGQTGNGTDLLNVPVFAIQLPNHDILIVDQGNNRIIEVNKQKEIVWSYGPTSGEGELNAPNSAELLPNGNILIADENNNRTIEIATNGQMVWQCCKGLGSVAFASRLANGNTLITDAGNNRIIEVTTDGKIVFQYYTNSSQNSNPVSLPTNSLLLQTGQIIISDSGNDRTIIITPNGQIEFQYGITDKPGVAPDQLNWPYTASVIGDYYGQTPPPPTF
jgi:virulence-associated protein VagC